MSDLNTFDLFWLGKGQELVTNTITNLNKQLVNYRNYLDALMGLYLLGGASTTAFFQSTNLIVYLCFIIPIGVVQIARYKTSIDQEIDLEALDIRSPLSINDTHNKLTLHLKIGVDNVKQWIGVATFVVVLGASVGMYFLNKDTEKNAKDTIEKTQQKELVAIENELLKDVKKTTKFTVVFSKEKNLLIEAKFPETMQIVLIGTKEIGKPTTSDTLRVPAKIDYKYQVDFFQTIDKVVLLPNN